jgi:hypothetical protein
MDNFPALVILTSLRALAASPALKKEGSKEYLLFREGDLAKPDDSDLFRKLRQSHDSEVRRLADALIEGCRDLNAVPEFEDVVGQRCHVCGSRVLTANEFCPGCGRPMRPTVTCHKTIGWLWRRECGFSRNLAGWRHCARCGALLSGP